MKLETENTGTIHDPQEADMITTLSKLDGFAILSHDDLTYLQTSRMTNDRFVLEYQEGATDEHFACPDQLTLEQVTSAFLAYARGDESWRTTFRWQKENVKDRSGCLGLLALGWIFVGSSLLVVCNLLWI
jgi:hypothetical protein